jgi:hypothetical protein
MAGQCTIGFKDHWLLECDTVAWKMDTFLEECFGPIITVLQRVQFIFGPTMNEQKNVQFRNHARHGTVFKPSV